MWEIYEHRNAVKELDALPVEILKRYEKWKDIVRISGPQRRWVGTGSIIVRHASISSTE